ncbi:MAG: ferrous iron transport protein A [Kineosporiaceae bacterium]|nr:ferrous iron transport protein A [Kineosporiaceae bacterium]
MVTTGTLAQLRSGDRGHIGLIDPSIPEMLRLRLRHLGFRPGTVVEVIRRAPFGGPSVYRLCDYDICLRREHARHVLLGEPA